MPNVPPSPEGGIEALRRELVAAVIVRAGTLLLVTNIKYGIRLEFPGGKVEPGEELEAAVLREIDEEIGCRARVVGRLDDFETESVEGKFIVHNLVCEIDGEPQEGREPQKIGPIRWYSFADLADLAKQDPCPLAPNVVAMLGVFDRMLAEKAD
jgi:8-oxo-dGTP diphosphatase